jgi:hypothetical protein
MPTRAPREAIIAEQEQAYQVGEMSQITDIFNLIKTKLNTEFVLLTPEQRNNLENNLTKFEIRLLTEISLAATDNNRAEFAMATANKLLETVNIITQPHNSAKEKNQAIDEFQYLARNSRFSKTTKAVLIGVAVGLASALAVTAAILLNLALIISLPAALTALTTASWFSPTVMGVSTLTGAAMGTIASKCYTHLCANPYENRGKETCTDLRTLVKQRQNSLIMSRLPEPDLQLKPITGESSRPLLPH